MPHRSRYAVCTGISLTESSPPNNINLSAAECSFAGPVGFLVLGVSTDHGTGQIYLFAESQSPKRPIPPKLFLSPNSLLAEIRFGLRLAYPAGDGSPAILRSMLT
jgi:hypothetical protein